MVGSAPLKGVILVRIQASQHVCAKSGEFWYNLIKNINIFIFMNKKNIIIAVVLIVVIVGVMILFGKGNQTNNPSMQELDETSHKGVELKFSNPKKSAHYESNTPTHGALLAAAPINIVINVNFDLVKPSSISITSAGKDYGIGDTIIDSSKLAMRRSFDSNAPDGIYAVSYKACWPDTSCHDGNFEFAIDLSSANNYEDMTGKSEVIIKLSDIEFKPKNIKISRGTKITWINDDGIDHYVNTDSHPAHTYYPSQNSRVLKRGDSYTLMFSIIGLYPYHCSAHADIMMGNILVL